MPASHEPMTEGECDWNAALARVLDINGSAWDRELTYAKTWAERVEVDYDEGPCAIGFVKGGSTYWFLIEETGCQWDSDGPRGEMLESLIAECERLRGEVSQLRTAVIDSCDSACSIHDRRDALKAMRRLANDTSKPFSLETP